MTKLKDLVFLLEEYDIIKQEIIEELEKNPLASTDYRMYHSPQFGFAKGKIWDTKTNDCYGKRKGN